MMPPTGGKNARGRGVTMGKKSVLALLAFATFAAAVVVGMGASAAFAGEQTGNCNNAKPGSSAADNCKTGQNPNANSICAFSGQNDNPNGRRTRRTALAVHRRATGSKTSWVLAIRARRIPARWAREYERLNLATRATETTVSSRAASTQE